MHVPPSPAQALAGHLQPSPVYLDVVQRIGERIGLDGHELAQGRGFELEGRAFWIDQGFADPDGLILHLEVGRLPAEGALAVCRCLLEQNAAMPVNSSGFALMPGTDMLVFRQRFDLARLPDPVEGFMHVVQLLTAAPAQLAESLAAARGLHAVGSTEAGVATRGSVQ